jgi:hypothetical protein
MNSSVRAGSLGPLTVARGGVSWRNPSVDVWQTDGDLLTLRAHGDTCCSRRDGMPDGQRGAIVVFKVTPAGASEVGA